MINNELTDILIEYGKAHILTPLSESYLEELKNDFATIKKETNDFEKALLNFVEDLSKQVDNAITSLSNDDIIFSSEGDNEWIEAEHSFYIFDTINYFKEALYKLLTEGDRQNISSVFKNLETIETKINYWLYDSSRSPLRLTILNKSRNSHLSIIPEDLQFLYPWYYIFSDYDSDTINLLVDNFDIFLKKGLPVPEEIESNLYEIIYELERDEDLRSLIRKEYVLHEALTEEIYKHSSIRILNLGIDAAANYIVSEHIKKVGLVKLANIIIEEIMDRSINPYLDQSTKTFWLFIAAFCGPGLKDVQRVEIFEQVEDLMKTLDTNKLVEKKDSILNRLARWYKGPVPDGWMANDLFNYWYEILEDKAVNMLETDEDIDPNTFWNTLMDLSRASTQLTDLWSNASVSLKKIVGLIENIVPKSVVIPVPLRIDSGSREPGNSEIAIEKNPFYLSISTNKKNEYILLPPIKFIKRCTDQKFYKTFIEKIYHTKGLFWSGLFLDIEGNLNEVRVPEEITKQDFNRINKGNYSNAIIGISDNEEQLNHFNDLLNKDSQQDFENNSLDRVFVFIISFD